jgi:glycosyltransferase involved in cell wall biosynthesis
MNNSLISIIMPFKNTEEFLKECVDSILNQEETNWELLAVNDHSDDQSFELVEDYAKIDERIKVFHNEGRGIINALRLAYAKSTGGFITRMDSDDIMSLNKLAVLKANLEREGIGHVATGLVKYFSDKPMGDGFLRYEEWLNGLTKKGTNFSEIYKECVIPSPCWMVDREDFEKCEALRPNRYPEDYDLVFRFKLHGLKSIPCNQILHHWRDYSYRTSRVDDNYADNGFLEIKADYFLKLDYDKTKKLVLWGAGKKGKTLAKRLLDEGLNFTWVCDNPKKVGKDIYGVKLLNLASLSEIENPQSIITVANPQAKEEIISFFDAREMESMKDYFFFC